MRAGKSTIRESEGTINALPPYPLTNFEMQKILSVQT